MPKKAQGLTRPVTRAQANSYEKSYPNPGHRPRLGVTHLAELNGPGAYDEYHRRYEETRRILSNTEPESDVVTYTAKQRKAMKKMSPAQKRAFKKMLSRSPDIKKVRRKKATANRKRSTKRKPATRKAPTKKASSYKPNRMKRQARPLKKDFVASQMRKGRSEKQAKADWQLAHGRHTGAKKVHRGRQSRAYKGYKALRADIGPKSRWTYKYASKKGQIRDIPDHALLGFKTRGEYLQAFADMGEYGLPPKRAKRAAALEKKLDRLQARRERDAQKAYNRILAGKGTFTPNAEEITYEEFVSMRPRRKKKKSTKKKRTMRKNAARKTPQKRSKRTGKFVKSGGRRRKATSSRKRKATRKAPRRKSTAKRKTAARKSRKVTGKKLVVYVSNRKRRTTKKRRSMKRNQGAYAANRKRRKMKRNGRKRTYRKNAGFQGQLMESLKLGGLVVGGIAIHRVASNALDEMVLSKVSALNTGTIGEYRGIIGGAIAAAVGIGATMAIFKPRPGKKGVAAPIAAGMAASFLGGAIVTILKKSGQEKMAGYFSNYPNAEGSMYGHAIGSYYTFRPHEVMSGVGSYYEVPQPMAGFGNPMLTQAAAGMGNPMLTQAAAGFGNPMLTQAAAGMGQPQITQAAAGTGEYVAYGVEGIGEYDEMPVSGMPSYTDEGIAPNLHSAEQALSMAEAQAGVGSPEVPLQSTVNPTMIADPISNLPGGSRAGVFQGGDGIFG